MPGQILQKILAKSGSSIAYEFLKEELSLSELNSLLLHVFNERAAKLKASDLLRNYEQNRFVQPFDFDPIQFAEFELAVLKSISASGFEVLTASPLAPLGSCTIVGPVDQKNVISALRNTEVVADVTNVLALEIAKRKRKNPKPFEVKLSSTHRHVRAQKFDIPGFTAHFKIVSLVIGGRDAGNYTFEIKAIIDQVHAYADLLQKAANINLSQLHFQGIAMQESDLEIAQKVFDQIHQQLPISVKPIKVESSGTQDYYRQFRYKIVLKQKGKHYEIIDGGKVDWTQQLLQNKKERLMISGLGIEFLYRILGLGSV